MLSGTFIWPWAGRPTGLDWVHGELRIIYLYGKGSLRKLASGKGERSLSYTFDMIPLGLEFPVSHLHVSDGAQRTARCCLFGGFFMIFVLYCSPRRRECVCCVQVQTVCRIPAHAVLARSVLSSVAVVDQGYHVISSVWRRWPASLSGLEFLPSSPPKTTSRATTQAFRQSRDF